MGGPGSKLRYAQPHRRADRAGHPVQHDVREQHVLREPAEYTVCARVCCAPGSVEPQVSRAVATVARAEAAVARAVAAVARAVAAVARGVADRTGSRRGRRSRSTGGTYRRSMPAGPPARTRRARARGCAAPRTRGPCAALRTGESFSAYASVCGRVACVSIAVRPRKRNRRRGGTDVGALELIPPPGEARPCGGIPTAASKSPVT